MLKTVIFVLAIGATGLVKAQDRLESSGNSDTPDGVPMIRGRLKLEGLVTPVAFDRLGGIAAVVRFEIARPDRRETVYTFLTGSLSGKQVPAEVQVRGPDGRQLRLTAQEGADCTLSAVEISTIPTGRGSVISAVRRFSPVLSDNDSSAPAPMDVQVFRPVRRGAADESAIVLEAVGAPVVTRALCGAAETRRAMLTATIVGR